MHYRHSTKRKEEKELGGKIAFLRVKLHNQFNVVDSGQSSVEEDRFLIDYQVWPSSKGEEG